MITIVIWGVYLSFDGKSAPVNSPTSRAPIRQVCNDLQKELNAVKGYLLIQRYWTEKQSCSFTPDFALLERTHRFDQLNRLRDFEYASQRPATQWPCMKNHRKYNQVRCAETLEVKVAKEDKNFWFWEYQTLASLSIPQDRLDVKDAFDLWQIGSSSNRLQ